jgi:hypothetical protein
MKIFKYPLKIIDEQVLELPIGAKILALKSQGELPFLWATVEPEAKTEKRTFMTYGTGHPLPADMSMHCYIDTYIVPNLVFHVFELL